MTAHSEEEQFHDNLVSRAIREMREEAAETDRETYTEGETFPFSAYYLAGLNSRSRRLPSQRISRRRVEEE
jgi:hypothetical protein